jgi:hypothetical protein
MWSSCCCCWQQVLCVLCDRHGTSCLLQQCESFPVSRVPCECIRYSNPSRNVCPSLCACPPASHPDHLSQTDTRHQAVRHSTKTPQHSSLLATSQQELRPRPKDCHNRMAAASAAAVAHWPSSHACSCDCTHPAVSSIQQLFLMARCTVTRRLSTREQHGTSDPADWVWGCSCSCSCTCRCLAAVAVAALAQLVEDHVVTLKVSSLRYNRTVQ